MTDRAVILARGLGTRMRRSDGDANLAHAQAAAADAGLKMLMPVGSGRAFVDYTLNGLADAGYRDVCLVVGPEHDAMRAHLARAALPAGMTLAFAVQQAPLGTADAVLAAERFAGDARFLVINADNWYPPVALRALREAGEPALAAFGRAALLADGQIAPGRIEAYALLEIDADGYLAHIIEKPDAATAARLAASARVSMNCWLFDARIFEACRAVAPSPRGEVELPLAVQQAIDAGTLRIRALPFDAPVLDLSTRADVAGVARRLAAMERDA